jgi:mRNA-degrading endonuclease toxin of MazEF toxin-antitoxin module
MNTAKRGEVWLVDLGQPKDHEQAGQRPAVIFQTDDLSPLSTVVVIPLTKQIRRAGSRAPFGFPQGKLGKIRTRLLSAIKSGRWIAGGWSTRLENWRRIA